mmetsp:Transcript_955/g.2314  ORF Transcript_955/g.2314 Transcript_955/m.2314 type:complete len:522 (-) Transcript_955:4268-5833(-)
MYPESVSNFSTALTSLDDYVRSNPDPRWNQVKIELNEELASVKKIQQSLLRFKGSTPSKSDLSAFPMSSPPDPISQFPIEFSNPQYRGPENFQRFNGAPYSHHMANPPDGPPEHMPFNDYKDPDVWPPPTAKAPSYKVKKPVAQPQRQKAPAPAPAARARAPPARAPAPQAQSDKARNYNKPWLKNARPEQEEVKKQGSEKLSFMDFHYPDGQGPDVELIQMLESSVVVREIKVKFDDIAELDEAKGLLQEAVLLPLLMPEYFVGIKKPWKGVLMFGPPGTGKTTLAKAVANLGSTTFFNITAATLASKWRGDAEKLVRLLFEMARYYAPSTIFFDEIDSLGGKRGESGEHEASRRVKTELLVQIDGVCSTQDDQSKYIIILAATNRPWDLDDALLRRLEKRIYIPLPNATARKKLFELSFDKVKLDPNIDWDLLARKTEGYSGSDISILCRDAAMMPLRRKLIDLRKHGLSAEVVNQIKGEVDVPITMDDLMQAVKNCNKSVGAENLEHYSTWMNEYGNV